MTAFRQRKAISSTRKAAGSCRGNSHGSRNPYLRCSIGIMDLIFHHLDGDSLLAFAVTPSMQELHLELPEEFTSYGAHAALHDVLYAACSKVQGPVLVVYEGELLKYTVQDVSAWQLPQISANVGARTSP
ncbi:hypothetical protein B0H14DRAFT_2640331 [Mycena olivaceomarginata]|nr:hypothetical protein B0H14DRAFT_2640331 [Mycena olivaceomarginata]